MAAGGITGTGISGVLRMTWMQDRLAHVLDHCETDETSGTWAGLACPDHGLALGSDVDKTMLRRLATEGEIADIIWEAPEEFTNQHRQVFEAAMQAHHAGNSKTAELLWQDVQGIWSNAWAANYAALELLQNAGLARFSPAKPQRWVIASFEHHASPHGLPRPHIHNVVITCLTTAARSS